MKITIVKEDSLAVIDGLGFNDFDLSFIGDDVHAIQFDTETSKGEIEYKDDRFNVEITDITPYQSIIDAHDQKKAELIAKEQADEAFKETYVYKRAVAYPSIEEQLDMQYHDSINGTTTWKDKIAEVKTTYPKD